MKGNYRQIYEEKRSGTGYKEDRKYRLEKWKRDSMFARPINSTNYDIINLPAPQNFSLINNTDEVLAYLRIGKENLRNGNSVRFDISKISQLTPDTIPLLISHIRDMNYSRNIPIHGNAPEIDKFRKRFTESGFYKHVKSKTKYKVAKDNIMHNESNVKVKPDIAGDSVEVIFNHCPYGEDFVEPIYNIFIELMSNTHHHANLSRYGSSKWWLYLFTDEETQEISLSFLDLGVGIFKSLIFRSYLKKLGRSLKLTDNTSLVADLLNGKIQSRIEIDNEIRGKGIPQIVEYSKLDCFEEFYLITNDVKIDLKTNTSTKLKEKLNGTFYFVKLKTENIYVN